MPDSGSGFSSPYNPGRPGSPMHHGDEPMGISPPFAPGVGEPPPEVMTDQVASLAGSATALPSIDEFLYDEPPAEPMRAEPPMQEVPSPPSAPLPSYVPPLPGFTGATAPPAPPRAHDFTPRTPAAPYPAPVAAPIPLATPAAARPQFAEPAATPEPRATPAAARPPFAEPATPRGGENWASGEWQSFDWRSAGSLAPEERARAAQAWADLDWEAETKNRVRARNEAIAAALEGIARRVRTGELLVHGHPEMTEEAAAAAALAALLARRS